MWICSYGVPNCEVCKRDGAQLFPVADEATDRLYFRIPYADKDEAKKLGARWDPQLKLWYSFLRNPQLVELGKRWQVKQVRQATATKPPLAAQAVARRSPPTQMSLESLLDTPMVAQTEPEPKPGSVPYEEFMAAIRAADERDEVLRTSKPQVRQHLMEPVTKESRK